MVDLVQSILHRAHEGRSVEKRKDNVEIIEVTVREVSHEVHIRVVKLHGRRLEHGGHPLKEGVGDGILGNSDRLDSHRG